MPAPYLLISTGDPLSDNVLRDVVARLEAAFSGRVRAYYLQGSRADSTDVATSDLDVRVLFAGDFGDCERAPGRWPTAVSPAAPSRWTSPSAPSAPFSRSAIPA